MGAEEDVAVPGVPGDPAVLAGRLFGDMAGALELLTVYLGERLGLYQALHAVQRRGDSPRRALDAGGGRGVPHR